VPDKPLLELLNSYLAIEGLLQSRLITEETRRKAYLALKTLNLQFAQALDDSCASHLNHHNKAA
jgi:hypothetical protein